MNNILFGNWSSPNIPSNSLNHEIVYSRLQLINDRDVSKYQDVIEFRPKTLFAKEYNIDGQNVMITVNRLGQSLWRVKQGDIWNSVSMQFNTIQLKSYMKDTSKLAAFDVNEYFNL